jgi:hypothetical protein
MDVVLWLVGENSGSFYSEIQKQEHGQENYIGHSQMAYPQ